MMKMMIDEGDGDANDADDGGGDDEEKHHLIVVVYFAKYLLVDQCSKRSVW